MRMRSVIPAATPNVTAKTRSNLQRPKAQRHTKRASSDAITKDLDHRQAILRVGGDLLTDLQALVAGQ